MFREGGHRPRDARAFLSVCGLTVTSQKATTKDNTTHKRRNARRSLDLGHLMHFERVPRLTQGRERATRAVSKNKHPPTTTRLFFDGPGATEGLFLQARVRAARGGAVASHGAPTCHGGVTTQQSVGGRR